MCEIKKILFPVDFSDTCLGAARYVEAFVGHFEAELMLLHVIDESSDEEQQWLSKVQLDGTDGYKYLRMVFESGGLVPAIRSHPHAILPGSPRKSGSCQMRRLRQTRWAGQGKRRCRKGIQSRLGRHRALWLRGRCRASA